MRYICIDIGTTTIKGIVYDERGFVVNESYRNSNIVKPESGFMEQEPDAIKWNLSSVLKELVSKIHVEREEVGFISLSAYMHSLVAVDEDNNALTNVMLWNDRRSQEFVERAKKDGKGIEIYRETGTPVHPMSPLYKIIYLREKENEIFEKSKRFVGIKEIILHWMTGEWVVDESIASATGMYNIHSRKWDEKALEYAGITEENLPKVFSTTHVMDELTEEFKNDLGLEKDIPIVLGASDGCLANLGSHGHGPEDILIAAIRGVSFCLRDVFEVLLKATDTKVNEFYVNGGFTKSDIWVQTFCNIVDRPVFVTEQGDGPLFGAFLLGILAIGKIKSLDEAKDYFISGKEYLPIENYRRDKEFDIYKRAIVQNRSLLHELAKLSSSVDDK